MCTHIKDVPALARESVCLEISLLLHLGAFYRCLLTASYVKGENVAPSYFFFKYTFIYYVYGCLSLYVSVYQVQKRALDFLGLELWMV